MNLFAALAERVGAERVGAERAGKGDVGVALIGCGKFATMFLAQVPRLPAIEVLAIADLDPARVRANLEAAGWNEAAINRVAVTTDAEAAIVDDGVEIVVEATGDALAGTRHALAAIDAGRHLVMVNVEADVLVGPALAERARAKGLVYSMAYGDQPALIAEQVDWARTAGLEVIAAGKGTKYRPEFHDSTPDTVWPHYGLTPERAAAAGMNPKMFNSFLDGTKSAIEMAAVANATGLAVPEDGLRFPPTAVEHLPLVLRPEGEGGCLDAPGMVEVVSSIERDGRPIHNDLRWGVYVVFRAHNDYVARCFADYGLITDPSGRYAALWRPYHLIGLELAVSLASIAVRGEPTGSTRSWRGDVVACAKRDLDAGDRLDGEGGYAVYGRLTTAARSARDGLLPIGLAEGAVMKRRVRRGGLVGLDDVSLDEASGARRLRASLVPS